MKKFVLIDGNALVHRAFHALPPLTTKKGEPINAVYGFLSILLKVLNEFKPAYIAATFDLAAPTFRHNEFEEYKATRVKAPQELYDQLAKVKEVITALGIPIYEKEGFEADDVVGTLAVQAKKSTDFQSPDSKIIITTGDLDTLQLVDEKVNVYAPKKGIKETMIYDIKAVLAKYGLKPAQLPDFKALKGDPSDNIPGVPGIGEKTAIELLQEYQNLENLYENVDLLPEKISKKLKEYKEQAFFSRYLATIRTDVPIELDLKKCFFKSFYNKEGAKKILENLEFFSLLKRLPD